MEETKIITSGWPKDDQILIYDAKITYIQNPDCTEGRDSEPQEIVISTRDNGLDKFLNLKTENWSISDEKDMEILIKDFKSRAGMNE